MPGECGWYKKTDWKLDNGNETRSEAKIGGTADGVVQIDTDTGTFSISYRVPEMPEGTFTRHDWSKPQGYCQERNNEQMDKSEGRVQTMPGLSVSMKGTIDPKRPDDIEVIRIEPDSSGKGQHYWSLRLHRQDVE
jgi:hypothetical protein